MPYQIASFKGDKDYPIDCTGDAVAGDEVRFERAVFSGWSFTRPQFLGFEVVTATIKSESYGEKKKQHTFTLLLENGETLRIKGRNLYKNGLYRKVWADETQRDKVLQEKHQRGNEARLQKRKATA